MADLLFRLLHQLHLRDWYAVAGLLLAIAIQLHRRYPWLGAKLWARIPDGARFLVPLFWGAVVAFVTAFDEGKTLVEALKAGVGGALTIGVGAMGVAAGLKESPLPWSGGAGGKPKASAKPMGLTSALAVASLVALMPYLPSCAPQGDAVTAQQERGAVLAYNAAALALDVAAGLEADRMSRIAVPTGEQVEAAGKRLERLQRARDLLAIVRSKLAGEAAGDPMAELQQALALLELLVAELEAGGVKVPASVAQGLAAVKAWIGDAS